MTTRAAQNIYDTDAVVRVHGVAMGSVPNGTSTVAVLEHEPTVQAKSSVALIDWAELTTDEAAGSSSLRGPVLGSGSFGTVLRARWQPRLPNGRIGPEQTVAVKVVFSKSDLDQKEYDQVIYKCFLFQLPLGL